jgi:aspartoacylase
MQKIRRVAIVGGTHGNELTGAYLVRKFMRRPELVQREGFETLLRIGNEKAVEACVRYIEKDLNRRFTLRELADPTCDSYEDLLAKELNASLGPKGAEETVADFILDLHTTTANMGTSVILDHDDPLSWRAAAALKARDPELTLFTWRGDTDESAFVHTIAPSGFALELGPIPQGVLRADLFHKCEATVHHLLDFFQHLATGLPLEEPDGIEIYEGVSLLDFPRDACGDLAAMIHPDLQDRHYPLLHPGDPLFLTFDGETLSYEGPEPLHAVFINEAAYYEKGFAMALAKRRVVPLP